MPDPHGFPIALHGLANATCVDTAEGTLGRWYRRPTSMQDHLSPDTTFPGDLDSLPAVPSPGSTAMMYHYQPKTYDTANYLVLPAFHGP